MPLALLALLLVPAGSAGGTLEYSGNASAASLSNVAPLSGGAAANLVGTCAAREVATVPSTSAHAHASVAVSEPSGCASGSTLIFLPALNVSNALGTTTGHTLEGSVAILNVSGASAMIADLDLYLQSGAAGHAILTVPHARIVRGAISIARSASGTLAPGTAYGLGLLVRLLLPASTSTATLSVALEFTLADGGVARATEFESVAVSLTY